MVLLTHITIGDHYGDCGYYLDEYYGCLQDHCQPQASLDDWFFFNACESFDSRQTNKNNCQDQKLAKINILMPAFIVTAKYDFHGSTDIGIDANNYMGNFDVYRGDLAYNIPGLAKACEEWSDASGNVCHGFNSGGWMKCGGPGFPQPLTGGNLDLYVKQGTYISPGYNKATAADARVGNGQGVYDCAARGDIAHNIPELEKACDSIHNCLGFNTNGWMKCGPRGVLPALTADSRCDFYSKKSAKFGKLDFTPPPQWASIIRAYAPVYRIHPSESYFPVDPLDWFSQVTLWERNAPGSDDGSQVSANDHNLRSNLMSTSHHASSAEDQFNYEFLTPMMPDGSNVYGHMGGAAGWSDCNQLPILCGSPNAKNNINNIPVYAIAVDKPDVNAVDVFYWTWWGYNQGKYIGASTIADVVCGSSWNPANWPCRAIASAIPGTVIQNHFSDLEHVVIRFNRNTGKPSQLWMDHHGNDDQYSRRTWNADGTPNGFQTKGVKPVVYVAQGSHEGYPQVGSFLTFASTNGLLHDFLSMTADGVLDHTADGGVEWDAEANLQVRWGVTEPRTPPAISYVRTGDGDVMHSFMREDGTIKQEDAWMCYGGRVGILEASGSSLYYSAMNPVIRVDAPEGPFTRWFTFADSYYHFTPPQ
ncbi:hypothetical protein HK101_000515 [Irineochytrium annulatum]|nr:hypothetical protein HK101_000515 [Irineochytrium annulatum]